jgi:hypothetical protein
MGLGTNLFDHGDRGKAIGLAGNLIDVLYSEFSGSEFSES